MTRPENITPSRWWIAAAVPPLPMTLARRFRPLSGGRGRAGSFKNVNDLRVGAITNEHRWFGRKREVDVGMSAVAAIDRATRLVACDETTTNSAVAGCTGTRRIATVHPVQGRML